MVRSSSNKSINAAGVRWRSLTQDSNTKFGTDAIFIRTAESRHYHCVVLDLYRKDVVDWSMRKIQARHYIE